MAGSNISARHAFEFGLQTPYRALQRRFRRKSDLECCGGMRAELARHLLALMTIPLRPHRCPSPSNRVPCKLLGTTASRRFANSPHTAFHLE